MSVQGHASGHSVSVLLWVEHTLLLEDLGDDRDGRVDGVGDDKDERLGRVLCDASREIADDTCVNLRRSEGERYQRIA